MSCFNERVVVVLGAYIDNGRSGTEAVKRMIRYMSCSGSCVAFAMFEFEIEGSCGGARRCRAELYELVGVRCTLVLLANHCTRPSSCYCG
jgi:hypothetical protein